MLTILNKMQHLFTKGWQFEAEQTDRNNKEREKMREGTIEVVGLQYFEMAQQFIPVKQRGVRGG
jgi:hypothetical protein